jgi:hypothetical protein
LKPNAEGFKVVLTGEEFKDVPLEEELEELEELTIKLEEEKKK